MILSRRWDAFAQAEAAGYFEREFGITEGLCRKVLAKALAQTGDFADLYFEHTISNYLILEDGRSTGRRPMWLWVSASGRRPPTPRATSDAARLTFPSSRIR